ncbi:hypothetical protein FRB90_012499 [Tulasnella sp. 427]|nr:hypothetical protein FRB90_012499 [Tulasnella sp. 427]
MNGHTSLYSFTIDFELGPDNQCGVCFSPDYSIIDLEALPSPGVIAQDKGSEERHPQAWDVVLSGEDVLLFSESLDEVTYAAYFGLRALLPTNGSLDIEKSPSVIRTHRYNVTKISGLGEMHWYAVHPWDTPHWQTDGLVPVFFEATPPEQQPESDVQCRSVVGMHWFSPSQIIESLKSGGTLPDGSRQIKYLSNECVLSAIDEASTLVPSTYGRKLLWVNVPSEPDQPQSEDVRLEMISIRTPWHTDVSEHASGIQYNLPINLGLVHRVDFDDENGKLLVIVCSEDEEDTRYIAHIFVY